MAGMPLSFVKSIEPEPIAESAKQTILSLAASRLEIICSSPLGLALLGCTPSVLAIFGECRLPALTPFASNSPFFGWPQVDHQEAVAYHEPACQAWGCRLLWAKPRELTAV